MYKYRDTVSSFLKWAGGKGQLLEQFARFFPETLEGRHYVEPFVGSGAVFFHVKQTLNPRSCTLLDVNPEMINAFRQIRDNVEELILILSAHKSEHNREGIGDDERKVYYYAVREQQPAHDSTEGAARFIYLNKTCFNGLHRLNSKGRFNVPIGSYKNPAIFDANHLRQVAALLCGVAIETAPFQKCTDYIGQGDFVYFDPPYEPLSRTSSFTSYAKDDFTPANQRELHDLVDSLTGRCDWMLSNSTAPLIEELYDTPRFHKHHVLASRSINRNAEGRGKIQELLVTNYEAKKEEK